MNRVLNLDRADELILFNGKEKEFFVALRSFISTDLLGNSKPECTIVGKYFKKSSRQKEVEF